MTGYAALLDALSDDLHTWGAGQVPPVAVYTSAVPTRAEGGPDLETSVVVVLGLADTVAEGRFRDKAGASAADVMTARVHGPFAACVRAADAVLARWAREPLAAEVTAALAAYGFSVISREIAQFVPIPRASPGGEGDSPVHGRQVAVRFTLFS